PYVCMGLPVIFGIGIMNGKGLCSAVNSVGTMDGGEGLTFFELNNLAMETRETVQGAVDVWKDNPREVVPGLAIAIILNANSIIADAAGEAAVIEHSHNHMEVHAASQHGGILASANHYQFLDRSLASGADPDIEPMIAGSFARLDRMWELLETFKGDIEPRTVKLIASDHGLNYSSLVEFGYGRSWYEERVDDATICCHPWNMLRHLKRLELEEALVEFNTAKTLNHMLMDPQRCTVYLTLGNPCRKQYVPIWLGDALRMEWADRAREEIDYEAGLMPAAHRGRKGVFLRPDPTRISELIRSLGVYFFGALDRAMSGSLVRQG
ncbi:MAG: carcinine hydrolase/isopenicillin-N N-acyltransferase family protein, partial [Actinomycetota bacterium]